jgi:peptidylprolyl isomerase/peptidyl-prolyl cis-trans isomerase B (cyclophilin B)|tara:strand:- start:145 stop:675 length:531 start_codon:yes stop_codon:yes gene_type:complete
MKKLVLSVLAMFAAVNANAEIITGEESMTEVQKQYIKIETKYGDIFFEFFEQDAPKHVEAFKKLTTDGFYNGLVFHRVVPDFVAQTGDPTGTGTGGPGYNIKAEFNSKPHIRGAVGMARAGHPDSAGSQFYFVLKDARFLDGDYTVFGQVVKGMEVVDQITQGDKMDKVTIVTEIE